MSNDLNFYKWFNDISKKLGPREVSFKKIFKYLDSLPNLNIDPSNPETIGNLVYNDLKSRRIANSPANQDIVDVCGDGVLLHGSSDSEENWYGF